MNRSKTYGPPITQLNAWEGKIDSSRHAIEADYHRWYARTSPPPRFDSESKGSTSPAVAIHDRYELQYLGAHVPAGRHVSITFQRSIVESGLLNATTVTVSRCSCPTPNCKVDP
jgi:hypothetical protein